MLITGACLPCRAAVPAAEAARLAGALTPTGAERAGNAAGTIPPWTGGFTTATPGAVEGSPRPDPFAADRPLYAVTRANLAQHADQLPEGMKALFARDPDMRMVVYPTRRSAALPARVYAAIARNAVTARAAPEGIAWGVAGASGGLPFPIPANGTEAIWNHLLGYWGEARDTRLSTWAVLRDGRVEHLNTYREIIDFPYYESAPPPLLRDRIFARQQKSVAPAERAGEGYVQLQPMNAKRDRYVIWEYLPGERRVREAPSLSYDTPDPSSSGLQSFDDYYMFSGGPDRYVWRLLGKREMLVPYNNNRLYGLPTSAILGPRHANPDALRYELHRVWVVDATLAPGARHISPHRRFYLDEDSWMAVYADAWDADGRLWRFSQATMYLVPELPAIVPGSQFVYDLDDRSYAFTFAFNDERVQYRLTPPHDATTYSPDALALDSLR
jgi:hypothetical protein